MHFRHQISTPAANIVGLLWQQAPCWQSVVSMGRKSSKCISRKQSCQELRCKPHVRTDAEGKTPPPLGAPCRTEWCCQAARTEVWSGMEPRDLKYCFDSVPPKPDHDKKNTSTTAVPIISATTIATTTPITTASARSRRLLLKTGN